MAGVSYWYQNGLKDSVCGTVDLKGDTLGFMLMTGYAYDLTAHHYRSSVTGEVPSATGYTYGGATITGNTVSLTGTVVVFTFSNVSWTTASFSASQAAVYNRRGGTSSADELLLYIEFAGTSTVSAGTFTYQVPATGQAAITPAGP